MHIPAEQFDRVPIYMLSPTPSPPNEKSSNEPFQWPSTTVNHDQKSDNGSDGEAESKSLPPKINVSGSRMSRLVKMLTLHHSENAAAAACASESDNSTTSSEQNTLPDGDSTGNGHANHYPSHHRPHLRGAPLVKVCRDCKILVRHLIDNGRANFNIRSRVESEVMVWRGNNFLALLAAAARVHHATKHHPRDEGKDLSSKWKHFRFCDKICFAIYFTFFFHSLSLFNSIFSSLFYKHTNQHFSQK